MILISSQSYYTFCSCTVDILDMFGSSEEQDSTDHRAALDNALTSGSEFSLCYINCICKQNIEKVLLNTNEISTTKTHLKKKKG